jgi:hypothetical protein
MFVLFLVLIKNAVKKAGDLDSKTVNATFPDFSFTPLTFQDYITAMRAQRLCTSGANNNSQHKYDITGMPNYEEIGRNWQVPFVKCDSRKCDRLEDETGMSAIGMNALSFCEFAILAVAGSNDGGQTRAQDFQNWIYATYPSIDPNSPNKASLPFSFDLVRIFNTSDEIETYVKSNNYGRLEYPKIAMAIVFEGNDNTFYNYTLRQNSTNFNSPEDEGRPTAQTTPPTEKLLNSFARNDFFTCVDQNGTPYQGPLGFSCTGQYFYNGVLTIQRLVNDFIIDISGASATGHTVSEAGVHFTPFPTKAYEMDGFYASIGGTWFCFAHSRARTCLIL